MSRINSLLTHSHEDARHLIKRALSHFLDRIKQGYLVHKPMGQYLLRDGWPSGVATKTNSYTENLKELECSINLQCTHGAKQTKGMRVLRISILRRNGRQIYNLIRERKELFDCT